MTHDHEPRRRSPYFLPLAGLSLVGAAVFGILAAIVAASESVASWDTAILQALQRHAEASPGLVRFFRFVTWFGTFRGLTALTVVAVVGLAWAGRRRLAIAWLVTLISSGIAVDLLKNVFDRPRPVWEQPLAVEETFSFPSGHAACSAVGYGLAAYCLALRWRAWRRRLWLVAGLTVWVLLIGFSRMYLGVHYLTDVLAGYTLGLAWLAGCIVVIEELRARL